MKQQSARFVWILTIALFVLVAGAPAPCGADPMNEAGIKRFREGDYETALSIFGKAIELRPNDAQGYLNRGAVYMVRGQYDLAIRDFNMAVAYNPASSEAYTNRAAALVALRLYPQAFADATVAIHLDSGNPEAYYTRAVAAFMNNSMDTVWMDLMNSQRLGFEPAGNMLNLYRRMLHR